MLSHDFFEFMHYRGFSFSMKALFSLAWLTFFIHHEGLCFRLPVPKGKLKGACSKVAFFPGQGNQKVGMGKETFAMVPAAQELYKRASAVLGFDLEDVVMRGPSSFLDQTNVTQPAILVSSLAAVERWKWDNANSDMSQFCATVGFSIGEYSALVFAGVLSFEDAVRLTRIRGSAMQRAALLSPQKMIFIEGPDLQSVESVCREASGEVNGHVDVANVLAPGINVISGDVTACNVALTIAKEKYSVKKYRHLPVSGAFHSSFMKPAQDDLAEALSEVRWRGPSIPIVFNVDAQVHTSVEIIRNRVEAQLTGRVLLDPSFRFLMEHGVREGIEFGPSSGMGGFWKKVFQNWKNPTSDTDGVSVVKVL